MEGELTSSRTSEGPPELPPAMWNPDAAGAWSLLLTPVFGTVLLLKNWQSLQHAKGERTAQKWLLTSLVVVVLVVLLPTPFDSRTYLVYIIIWYLVFQRNQTRYVVGRWGRRYPKKRWGLPLVVGFAVAVTSGVAISSLRYLM